VRLRTIAALPTAVLAIAALPAAGQAARGFCGGHGVCTMAAASTTIGTGAKTCTLTPGADCRGVVHRWGVEHHGNLRKAKFTKADLRGADFRGADLRGADFRGAKLRHADLREARLTGARFGHARRNGKRATQSLPPCGLFCEGADLAGAYLQNANLANASFFNANLTFATLDGANLTNARLNGADLSGATLIGANLTRADLRYASLGPLTFADPACDVAEGVGCVVRAPSTRSLMADLAGVNWTCANLSGVVLQVFNPKNGEPVAGVNTTGAIGTPYIDTSGAVTNTSC